jgi:hypothetical protein
MTNYMRAEDQPAAIAGNRFVRKRLAGVLLLATGLLSLGSALVAQETANQE